MKNWTEAEMNEAMDAVEAKATTDKEFRALCLSNPNEALRVATGKEIDPNYKIKFVEADPAYHETWALPAFKADADSLSDADLDMVAGGK